MFMLVYHCLALHVPPLFEIKTWNLEALERWDPWRYGQDAGSLFKLASDRGFLTYTGKFAGERPCHTTTARCSEVFPSEPFDVV